MAEETKIIRIVVDSSRAVDGSAAATRAYERMERAQRDVASSMDRMERSLGRMGGFLKAQLALAVADIAARLVQMGKNAFDAAAGLDELAEQIGVTNKFLQASQFLAAQNGVKLEQLETAYGKFSQKMGEAADGSKEMIEALEKLGVKNLDVAGKLRPTEDLMQDVAAAIAGIDDPARRAAAAVDFFGKSGTKLLPMMAEIGNGADAMAAKMIAAGTYIGPETSKRLDEMADAAERASLRWRAVFANMISATADWYERNRSLVNLVTFGLAGMVELIAKDPQRITGAIDEAYDVAIQKAGDWIDDMKGAFDTVIIVGARFVAGFGEAIRSIPDLLGKAFVDGMNKAIEGLEAGLGRITTQIEKFAPWLGIKGGSFNFGRVEGGGASLDDRNAGIKKAEDKAEADMRARGYAVNSGTGRAVKALMVVLGAQKLGTVDQATLFWPLICERLDNFLRIIGNDHSQAVFATGWANRLTEWWRPAGTPVAEFSHLAPADADGILVKGEKGGPIKKLQAALGVVADGDFGPATERAVIAFQKARGLAADGVAGPKTLAALGITLEAA